MASFSVRSYFVCFERQEPEGTLRRSREQHVSSHCPFPPRRENNCDLRETFRSQSDFLPSFLVCARRNQNKTAGIKRRRDVGFTDSKHDLEVAQVVVRLKCRVSLLRVAILEERWKGGNCKGRRVFLACMPRCPRDKTTSPPTLLPLTPPPSIRIRE